MNTEPLVLTKWDIAKSDVEIAGFDIDMDKLWDFLMTEAEKYLSLLKMEIETDETPAEFIARKAKNKDYWFESRFRKFAEMTDC